MSKSKTKFPITNRFETIKQMYKNKKKGFDLNTFNTWSMELLNILGECTMQNVEQIEGYHIDKWKDRVWNLIENAGLLPEYKEDDEEQFVEILDTWYTED